LRSAIIYKVAYKMALTLPVPYISKTLSQRDASDTFIPPPKPEGDPATPWPKFGIEMLEGGGGLEGLVLPVFTD
jgi:hypothetical protein